MFKRRFNSCSNVNEICVHYSCDTSRFLDIFHDVNGYWIVFSDDLLIKNHDRTFSDFRAEILILFYKENIARITCFQGHDKYRQFHSFNHIYGAPVERLHLFVEVDAAPIRCFRI